MTSAQLQYQNKALKVISLKVVHLNACMNLDELALNGLWSKQQWQKELTDPKRLVFGVISNEKLLAFASGWWVIDELHLTAIAVHPQHRRKGLGSLVISKILKEALSLGISYATLEVSNKNIAANKLYSNHGFTTAGTRKNYYKNGSDALIQWKKLDLLEFKDLKI